jgi:hypothetical protein
MLEMVASVRDSQAQRLQMIQQGGPVNSVLLSVMGFTVQVGQLRVSGLFVDVYSLDEFESWVATSTMKAASSTLQCFRLCGSCIVLDPFLRQIRVFWAFALQLHTVLFCALVDHFKCSFAAHDDPSLALLLCRI